MWNIVDDEESRRKYIYPFQKWYEEFDKMPSEPFPFYGGYGKVLQDNPSPLDCRRLLPHAYKDELLKFTDQFLDIFLDTYRKAEPVRDPQRRRKMDTFRCEWNKRIFDDNPVSRTLIEAFGREKAQLHYDYFGYL